MSDPVDRACEQLADALREAIMAALKAKGFYPSDRFESELHDLIRNNIGLGS